MMLTQIYLAVRHSRSKMAVQLSTQMGRVTIHKFGSLALRVLDL